MEMINIFAGVYIKFKYGDFTYIGLAKSYSENTLKCFAVYNSAIALSIIENNTIELKFNNPINLRYATLEEMHSIDRSISDEFNVMFFGNKLVKWRASLGEEYYYIDENNSIKSCIEKNLLNDDKHYKQKNYFTKNYINNNFKSIISETNNTSDGWYKFNGIYKPNNNEYVLTKTKDGIKLLIYTEDKWINSEDENITYNNDYVIWFSHINLPEKLFE